MGDMRDPMKVVRPVGWLVKRPLSEPCSDMPSDLWSWSSGGMRKGAGRMRPDHVVQRMRLGNSPGVVAFVAGDDDPFQAFREEVRHKQRTKMTRHGRRGDMHRWCGRRKVVRVNGVRFVVYVEG